MKLGRAVSALILVLAHGVAGAAPAAEAAGAPPPATSLPTLVQGALPNGFRYAILPHPGQRGGISLRLIVHAGSLDERDDELGYAHFVEHMAFNGTRHYPPGKLVRFFQRIGVAFGADLNGETSFMHTTYKIDLHPAHVAQFAEALRVFRDYADGIDFAPEEVQREKSVILSEFNARENADAQADRRALEALYAGTIVSARLPSGERTLVERADPARLEAFYARCYHPRRMTLLVVGNVVVEPTRAAIAETFASLSSPDAAIPPVLPTPPPGGSLRASVIASNASVAAVATLVSVQPAGEDSPSGREALLDQLVVLRALDRRLKDRVVAEPQRFGRAYSVRQFAINGRFIHAAIEAHAAAREWRLAVALLETELRRARARGFGGAEIAEAAAGVLVELREAAASTERSTAAELADEIRAWLGAGREWVHWGRTIASAEAYLSQFTPAAAAACLRRTFADDGLQLRLRVKQPPPGGDDEVLAAWRDSAAQPLPDADAAETGRPEFAYRNFGPPGAIASRRQHADLGLELVAFANGVRLNLRPSRTEPNHFRLKARIGRGFADVPRDRSGLALLALQWLGQSDLARHDRTEINRIMRLNGTDAGAKLEGNTLTITISGPTAELPFALQLLTAFLTDTKLDETRLPVARSNYSSVHSTSFGTSAGRARAAALYRISGRDARFRFPGVAEVARYSPVEIAHWIRACWFEGPVEIGLVGDFDPAKAVEIGAATTGTLSARPGRPLAKSERIEFLKEPYRHISREVLADRAATVCIAWPARDAADTRVHRALQIATAALIDRLRLELREKMGVTYSPAGDVHRDSMQRDFAYVHVELTFPPEQVQKLAERVSRIADQLAWDGLRPEEFARAREPLRAAAIERLQDNTWWLNAVAVLAQSQPAVLDDVRSLRSAFDDLTRGEVNVVIARHLREDNASVAGIIPVAPPPSGPKK